MAYSLTDYFRSLRLVLRLNGLLVGIGFGTLLLLSPNTLVRWGLLADGQLWPPRVAGALLIGLGCAFVFAANQRIVPVSVLVAALISNGLMAIVLLVAYLQGEFNTITITGTILLILVFVFCLIGAVTAIPYIRADYPRL